MGAVEVATVVEVVFVVEVEVEVEVDCGGAFDTAPKVNPPVAGAVVAGSAAVAGTGIVLLDDTERAGLDPNEKPVVLETESVDTAGFSADGTAGVEALNANGAEATEEETASAFAGLETETPDVKAEKENPALAADDLLASTSEDVADEVPENGPLPKSTGVY